MLNNADSERVRRLLAGRFPVAALWVFGSQATGRARAGSDIDLAVLFSAPVDPVDVLDARAELASELGRDVDLVDMARTAPNLARQVLGHGILILDVDPHERALFELQAPTRCEDWRIATTPIRRAVLGRARG